MSRYTIRSDKLWATEGTSGKSSIHFNGMQVQSLTVPPGRPNDIQMVVNLKNGETVEAIYEHPSALQVKPSNANKRLANADELRGILQGLEKQKDNFLRLQPEKSLDYAVLVQHVATAASKLSTFVPNTVPGSEFGFIRVVGSLDGKRGIHAWIGHDSNGTFYARKGRTPHADEQIHGRDAPIWYGEPTPMSRSQMKEVLKALTEYTQANPREASQYGEFMEKLKAAANNRN